jgi:hypothetical protein
LNAAKRITEKKIIQLKRSVTIADENGKTNFGILRKSNVKVTVGDDLGKCFGIKMIYFD